MNGLLYMVFDSANDNKIYIGSTTQSCLNKRLHQHINAFKSYLKNGKYNFYSIFNIFLNCNNFDFIEIKQIEKVENLKNEYELKILEQECITNFKILNYDVININRPINKNIYKKNKCYRDFYKKNKSCKIVLNCPFCAKNIKISISPLDNEYSE